MPTQSAPRLLSMTRRFLTFAACIDVMVFVGGAGLLAAALSVPEKIRVSADLAARVPSADARQNMTLIGAVGLILGPALLFPLFLQLRKLVDTAIAGDPFVADNGRRLRRIAWLIFGVDVVVRACTNGVAIAAAPRQGAVHTAGVLHADC